MARSGQKQGEYQVQTQEQHLTPQQVLLVRLTELPLNDLRDRIEKELEDNPYLLGEHSGQSDDSGNSDHSDYSEESDSAETPTTHETSDSFDDIDDGIPREPRDNNEERRSYEIGDNSESFYDHLFSPSSHT